MGEMISYEINYNFYSAAGGLVWKDFFSKKCLESPHSS
jgi:hypothetical protein